MSHRHKKIATLACWSALCGLAFGASIPSLSLVVPTSESIAGRLTESEKQKCANLDSYSVIRHYRLHNTHLKEDAEMTVRIYYHRGQGKTYQILNLKAEGMCRRVFQNLLDGEVEASNTKDNHAITSENYDFKYLGQEMVDGRHCYLLLLEPRHKSRYLLQGKVWVDAHDYAPVRIEARPSASLSFWIGKPAVIQKFEKVGGFWMTSENSSTSESHFLGASQLTVQSDHYEVLSAAEVAATGLETKRTPSASLN